MRYKDVEVKSVSDLIKNLKRQKPDSSSLVWFRGQGNSAWNLVPSLARTHSHLKAESALLKRFMQNAVPHLDHVPQEEWEWMFMMQHHRAPTRLLDWSEGPLQALYFAVSAHPSTDAAVWCLDPIALNNEARLKFPFTNEVPAFRTDRVLNSYLPSQVDQDPSVLNAIAIMGPRNTPRMAAQLGVFTINHRDHAPIEELGRKKHVWRWIVPAASKANILADLALLGYTPLTLFPELDRVADLARELLA